jgi:hypothetical protein
MLNERTFVNLLFPREKGDGSAFALVFGLRGISLWDKKKRRAFANAARE